MNKKYAWIALLCLALLVLAIFFLTRQGKTSQEFFGSRIVPPVPAADFILVNQDDQSVKLTDLRGKYLLLFFGFTSCTNECPATMAILREVRTGLADKTDLTRIVFISTDPTRDTPAAVKEFVNHFDPTAVGLTGSPSQLEPVWKDYGVVVLDGGETHSTRVYLVDPEGKLRLTYPSASDPNEIIHDIELLIEGS